MIIKINFPIQATGKRKPEKIRAWKGFEPVTSAIPVGCFNWAMKPNTGSEVSLLSSYLPLKPWLFQASSFQLIKLENLLRWSFFTFIYNRSSNMNYFIYVWIFENGVEFGAKLLDMTGSVLWPNRERRKLSVLLIIINYGKSNQMLWIGQ